MQYNHIPLNSFKEWYFKNSKEVQNAFKRLYE